MNFVLFHCSKQYWGSDLNIPYPRPAFKIDLNHRGTDIAAETAAACAAASILFREKYSDAKYADILLEHAKDLLKLAEIEPWVRYHESVPEVTDFYGSRGFGDELCWGNLWLYKATNDNSYLEKAKTYFTLFKMEGRDFPFNWNQKSPGVYVMFAQLIQGDPGLNWRNISEVWFDNVLTGSNDLEKTKGGLIWFKGTSEQASTGPALTTALLMHIYSHSVLSTLSGSSQAEAKRLGYDAFGNQQLDYILGNNPMKMPYVADIHPNSPKNVHHAGAHGGTDFKSMSNPFENNNRLVGAVVGGPNRDDQFLDDRQDYSQSEVALDYNAAFQSLIARQVMFSDVDPFYTKLVPNHPRPYQTILIIACAIAFAIILVAVVTYCLIGKKRSLLTNSDTNLKVKIQSTPKNLELH
ncbi:hypothetical protein K7432_013349 [Basidiobolus ranarum]|uniref:Endoglucanase n=1 Tax=Basidiobolus ranarum TaxID=34480 RepID=A0ABR2WJC4_9FUNG